MLRSCLLKSRFFIASLFAVLSLAGTMTLLTCTKDNPVDVKEPTWNFTLDVINGYTGNKISGASVQYMTAEQVDTIVATNSDGRVKIEGLAAGTQSFQVFYAGADSTMKFTRVVVEGTSVLDTATNLKKLADKAQTVKLFPLAGSVSGRVVTQVHAMAAKVPVANVVVSASYDNADLEAASNKAVQVKTDSTGSFSFTSLPVASGLKITVNPIPVGNVDYTPEVFAMPVLVSGITSPMGTIIMTPLDADNFSLLGSVPSVIAPNDTIKLTFSETLDSVATSAKLEGVSGSQSVAVAVKFKGATIAITPMVSLVDGSVYRLVVNAYGKTGGTVAVTQNVNVKGGGIIDVVGSNVLDANHQAKDGLGLSDSMVFEFRTDVDNASASVKNGSKVVLVDVTVAENSVIIKPKGNWESATFAVKVSANLDDGTASTFTFNISTVGAFDFVSSNVFNATTGAGINGIGFKDTIVFTANKSVASAKATLTLGGAAIPITIAPVSGATVKIVPNDYLRPSTQYTITLTVATAEGETKSASGVNFTTASSDFFPIVDNIRFDNDPNKPVLNFSPNGTIFIKMSTTVKSATAQLSGTLPLNVSVNIDTIKITPVGNLDEGVAYDLKVSAESNTGTVFQENFVNDFYVQPNKVFVVASNVMNVNGVGLTNVPVTIAPYFVLSATPVEASLAVTIKPVAGSAVDAIVTLSGDTVKVKPVSNLVAKTSYEVSIKGKTTNNTNIDISTSLNDAPFTTQAGVFVVATNMKDAEGNAATNLAPSTELWVKFSRALSTDLTKLELGGGAGTSVKYVFGGNANNATVRVSGDTLFAKFMANALPAYSAAISLTSVMITFVDASDLGAGDVDIDATIMSKAKPFVIATNGMKSNMVVDNFGVLSEVWIVSSLPFRSVDAVNNGPDGFTNVQVENKVISNVRTSGDTIFFKPAVRLAYATEYQVSFAVTLASDSSKYTGTDLKMRWKTDKALFVASANDLTSDKLAYRVFANAGDTLTFNFTKAIDTTKLVTLDGFVTKKKYVWASKLKLHVIPIDTIGVPAYVPAPDYTFTSGTAMHAALTLSLTTDDGEVWTTKAINSAAFASERPAMQIHTAPGLAILNSTTVVSNVDKTKFFVNTTNTKIQDLVTASLVAQNDSVGVGDTLKVYFNRAIDSVAVATSVPHAVQLLKGGAAGIDQNVTIWYGDSRKTMFVKADNPLTAGTTYRLKLTTVKAAGLSATGSALVSHNLDFKAKALATKTVTMVAPVLYKDTAALSTVDDKRIGYSGAVADAYNSGIDGADVAAQNTIQLYWKEVGFRNTADTVTHYQYSVKGFDNNWYELKGMVDAKPHFNSFSPFTDSVSKFVLDLSPATVNDVNGINISSAIKVNPNLNAASLFNSGTVVSVKIRPVVHMAAGDDFTSGDLAGPWSNTLTFSDNVAPCDNDFVGVGAQLNNAAQGGVTISSPTILTALADWDRTGDPTIEVVITLTFPEDMDLSTKPTMNIWNEVVPATGIAVNTATSYWSDTRTYKLAVTVPGNVDWRSTTGTNKPYCTFSVAGMKDASGQTIQSFGSAGTAANTIVLTTADDTESKGTVNMLLLKYLSGL